MSCGSCQPPWLDCSPEAQDERKRQIAAIWGKLRLGVRSVSDRGRSVTYDTLADMRAVIAQLQNEFLNCTGCRRRGRLRHYDQSKDL